MCKKKPGYTLVSVLVATVVVAIFASILANVSVVATRENNSIAHKTEAVFLAHSEMERVFAENIETLTSYEKDLGPEYPGFKKTVTVTDIANGKHINIAIEYPEGSFQLNAERYKPVE